MNDSEQQQRFPVDYEPLHEMVDGTYLLQNWGLADFACPDFAFCINWMDTAQLQVISDLDESYFIERITHFCYSEQIQNALVFARKVHGEKLRKVKAILEITHVITVALLVLLAGGSDEQVCSALLHDTVEDCRPLGSVTFENINSEFGVPVGELVRELTEPGLIVQAVGGDDHSVVSWFERKSRLVDSITRFSDNALQIKVADVLHNMYERWQDIQTYGENVWSPFNGDKIETIQHFKQLVAALELACTQRTLECPLIGDLRTVFNKLLATTTPILSGAQVETGADRPAGI